MNIQEYLHRRQQRINKTLKKILPSINKEPRQLHRAMNYAVFNGGKRIRSALIYAVGESLRAKNAVLSKCSAAVELMHAFSLVHDDLPAIDNDNLRRGKPACHKAFGEATALLAGDALLTLSFEVLSSFTRQQVRPKINLKMIQILSHYCGSLGMAGGEALDVAMADKEISLKKLAEIYKLKTSYLICASVLLGALAAQCDEKNILNNLEKYGLYLGLAFQIHDDLIGILSPTELLGKPQGSDVLKNKPTFPTLIGVEKAKIKEKECFDIAGYYLKKAGIEDEKLIALGEFIITRDF